MLKFGNKEFRNLQEQVYKNMKDILFILQEEGVLNEFGIKVVGQEESVANMPTVEDYKESNPDWSYGDAYAIGTKAPYTLYILTRANGTHPNDYWFNIGSFPVTGPQGPQGPQGEVGPQGQTGNPGTNGLDAGFGTISATAETVSPTDPATVTIATSGPNTAKNISFAFEIPQGEKGKDGASEWGDIGGSLENQTDLINALQAKQNASNAVTTDGTQTITGQKTFSNGVYIGSQMSIDSLANNTILDIKRNGTTEYRFATGAFLPNINNNYSLGTSVYKWKDLYLSGNLSDGTNSISVADIAPKSEYATKKEFDDLKSIVYGIHSLTYNSYEFPYLTSSAIPDEVDGRKVVGGSYAIGDWIGGNSFVYNQLLNPVRDNVTTNGITFINNNDGSFTFNGTATANTYLGFSTQNTFRIIAGHKYFLRGLENTLSYADNAVKGYINSPYKEWRKDEIWSATSSSSSDQTLWIFIMQGTEVSNLIVRPQITDLTLMGLDNITSVDEFKALFPLDYYPYNSGEIKSTILSKIESWGYNLCNGEWTGTSSKTSANFIKVVGGQTYTLEVLNLTTTYKILQQYNANKELIEASYLLNRNEVNSITLKNETNYVKLELRFSSATDIPLEAVCFHLTGSRTGYAPYVGKLGEINIPNAPLKLDGVNDIHNTLTFEEQEDGTYNAILTKRFGIVDLGSCVWTYNATYNFFQTGSLANLIKPIENNGIALNGLCKLYIPTSFNKLVSSSTDKCFSQTSGNHLIQIKDTAYTDATTFKTAMSGVNLLYELATPTTETIATGLTFDDTTLKIEKGGSIKAVYEGVPTIASIDFMTKGE